MSNIIRFGVPLLLIVFGLSQWILACAQRSLTIEDKARLTDATFRPWWITFVFAAVVFVLLFELEWIPRQWQWWSLFGFVVAVFVLSVASSVIQWRSLVRAGVAQRYVRTQLWMWVVLYWSMLMFFAAILYDALPSHHQ